MQEVRASSLMSEITENHVWTDIGDDPEAGVLPECDGKRHCLLSLELSCF